MKPSLIITHDGKFHADDVFAVALIRHTFGPIPVERRRTISNSEFFNPQIWIVDVGDIFEPGVGLFDHHQDPTLSSANMLVLEYLTKEGLVTPLLAEEIIKDYKSICDIDLGGYSGQTGFQVNSLIQVLNHAPGGWDFALRLAEEYLHSKQSTVDLGPKSAAIWMKGERINKYIRVCPEFPAHWKRYNEEPFLIVGPAALDIWHLHTIDTKTHPLRKTGKETFMHASRMLAGYRSKEDAIEGALHTIAQLKLID